MTVVAWLTACTKYLCNSWGNYYNWLVLWCGMKFPSPRLCSDRKITLYILLVKHCAKMLSFLLVNFLLGILTTAVRLFSFLNKETLHHTMLRFL